MRARLEVQEILELIIVKTVYAWPPVPAGYDNRLWRRPEPAGGRPMKAWQPSPSTVMARGLV